MVSIGSEEILESYRRIVDLKERVLGIDHVIAQESLKAPPKERGGIVKGINDCLSLHALYVECFVEQAKLGIALSEVVNGQAVYRTILKTEKKASDDSRVALADDLAIRVLNRHLQNFQEQATEAEDKKAIELLLEITAQYIPEGASSKSKHRAKESLAAYKKFEEAIVAASLMVPPPEREQSYLHRKATREGISPSRLISALSQGVSSCARSEIDTSRKEQLEKTLEYHQAVLGRMQNQLEQSRDDLVVTGRVLIERCQLMSRMVQWSDELSKLTGKASAVNYRKLQKECEGEMAKFHTRQKGALAVSLEKTQVLSLAGVKQKMGSKEIAELSRHKPNEKLDENRHPKPSSIRRFFCGTRPR